MIEGKDVALRLGFVGIKNRSQQDIFLRVPVKDAILQETKYFSSHETYSKMPSHLLGMKNLTLKLSHILFSHIKHNLPNIIEEIKSKISEIYCNLKELGEPIPINNMHKKQ